MTGTQALINNMWEPITEGGHWHTGAPAQWRIGTLAQWTNTMKLAT